MGTTPTYALPYPDPVDPADVPADMEALALAVETELAGDDSALTSLDTRVDALESGSPVLVSYTEAVSPLAVTAGSEAAQIAVGMAAPLSFVAGDYVFQFESPQSRPDNSAVGRILRIVLFDGSTALGEIAYLQTPTAQAMVVSVSRSVYRPVAAGSRQFSIRGWVNGGTGLIGAGAGGAGNLAPMYLRIAKVG